MTTLTPDQEAWLRDRIAAIEAADARKSAEGLAALKQMQAERDRAGVLSPQVDEDNAQMEAIRGWKPTPINWRRLAFYAAWACLFMAGCAGLGIGAFNWRAPFGLALAVGGLGVMGLLTVAARKAGR